MGGKGLVMSYVGVEVGCFLEEEDVFYKSGVKSDLRGVNFCGFRVASKT